MRIWAKALRAITYRLIRLRGLLWRKFAAVLRKVRDVSKRPRGLSSPQSNAFRSMQVVYINLESRLDRRQATLAELRRIQKPDAARFRAFRDPLGARGCAKSHQTVIRAARNSGKLLMVCEDDVTFLCDSGRLEELVNEFSRDSRLDVLLLGHNSLGELEGYSDLFRVTVNSQTTSCYIVKPRAINFLAFLFALSRFLLTVRVPRRFAAPDIIWKIAQGFLLTFVVPINRCVEQRASWSDIEKSYVDYGV